MYKTIINSLSAHVAVLDEQGIITETNRAWQEFARQNGLEKDTDFTGVNYYAVCRAAEECGDPEGELVAAGIRKVLDGEILEFVTQYPCHSPTKKQWFNLRVLPYSFEGKRGALVVHEDVTPIFLVQEQLRHKEEELRLKTEKLEETNTALKVLLEHRDRDLVELEQRIAANIKELVLPYVERLKGSLCDSREENLVDIVESNLNDIVTPFLNRLSSLHLLLTPQEVEVAVLVRQGKSSQEIADILGVALSTISFHRKNLRQKLQLSDRSQNLRTYLLSLR
jgi:DNA-binding CsgD family transcriptional regulator